MKQTVVGGNYLGFKRLSVFWGVCFVFYPVNLGNKAFAYYIKKGKAIEGENSVGFSANKVIGIKKSIRFLSNSENVARAIFSPLIIRNGILLHSAFQLRSKIQEDYVTVMRTSIPSWLEEVRTMPQNVNRKLCGYSNMKVGEIHSIDINSPNL